MAEAIALSSAWRLLFIILAGWSGSAAQRCSAFSSEFQSRRGFWRNVNATVTLGCGPDIPFFLSLSRHLWAEYRGILKDVLHFLCMRCALDNIIWPDSMWRESSSICLQEKPLNDYNLFLLFNEFALYVCRDTIGTSFFVLKMFFLLLDE